MAGRTKNGQELLGKVVLRWYHTLKSKKSIDNLSPRIVFGEGEGVAGRGIFPWFERCRKKVFVWIFRGLIMCW